MLLSSKQINLTQINQIERQKNQVYQSMIHNISKPHKLKQDRYEKFNKTSMILRESSFMNNSVETTATLNLDTLREEQKQCRICLHEEDPLGQKQLYSVCKCTGSVKHLHEQCFVSWVNRTLQQKPPQQRKKILQNGNQCQLCKSLIPIQTHTISQCASIKLIKHRITKKPFLFTIFTTIQILCLVVLGFVVGMMATLQVGFSSDKIVNTVVLIGSMVVLLCLTVGVGYSYVTDYFMEERVIAIGFSQDIHEKKKNEINHNNINHNVQFNDNSFINLNSPLAHSTYNKTPFPQPIRKNSQHQQLKQQNNNNISIEPINQQQHQNVIHIISSLQQLQQIQQ